MKHRRRLLATTIVLISALASAAYGDWMVTSSPAHSGSGLYDQPMKILVSLRNSTGLPLQIDSITKSIPIPTNCLGSITVAPLAGSFPIVVMPNRQAQFVVSTNGISIGETMFGIPGCEFDINESFINNATETFTTQFHVNTTGNAWDLQPAVSNFGSQSTSETQTVWILNNQSTGMATYNDLVISDATGSFTFATKCPGAQACASGGVQITAGAFEAIDITCDPTVTGPINGTVTLYGASAPLASKTLTCTGLSGATIDIVPTMVDIVGPGTNTASVSYVGMADWSMTGAVINGDVKNVFAFTDGTCTPHNCDWTSSVVSLPHDIEISCTNVGHATETATLVVQGIGGPNDFDTATLRCLDGGGGGPLIQLSTNQINVPSTAVNLSSAPEQLTITNIGTGTLTFSLNPGSTEWAATACQASQCSLTGNGSNTTVGITLTPNTYGDRSTSMLVNSDDTGGNGMLNVALNGSGSGATLDVIAPPSPTFEIDFGTIPRNSPSTRALTTLAQGNVGVTVNVGGAADPFTVTPSSLSLTTGTPDSFMVACQGSNAGGPFTQTLTVTSPDVYAWNTNQVTTRCTIADTEVEVMPATFAFDEVRVGAPAVDKPLKIHNPTSVPVTLHSLRLGGSSPVLSLSPTITSDMTIPPNGDVDAMLHLATTQDADLAGLMLLIDVDSANLSFPITGKVVTPAAHVAPATLELGTACVGSQITGTVMMINDGTATLTMERPTMNQAFTPVYQMPSTYPSPLLAGHSAMVGVTPAMSTAGTLSGVLTWGVDTPDAPYAVPVNLTFVPDGTAVSPRALAFGRIDVDAHSPKQTITLENCDLAPARVTIGNVEARIGAASAWQVAPKNAQLTLGAHEKVTISVELAPANPGHYAATLHVDVGGEDHTIELTGDAVGKFRDTSSFYACTCQSPGVPASGWPIAAAVVIVIVRRRRR